MTMRDPHHVRFPDGRWVERKRSVRLVPFPRTVFSLWLLYGEGGREEKNKEMPLYAHERWNEWLELSPDVPLDAPFGSEKEAIDAIGRLYRLHPDMIGMSGGPIRIIALRKLNKREADHAR